MMEEPILEFRRASNEEAGVGETSISVRKGQIVVLTVDNGLAVESVFDLALGLSTPQTGAVLFEGVSWTAMTHEAVDKARARVGRVYADGGWITNLSVRENVLLAMKYHHGLSDRELDAMAEPLLELVGMKEIPTIRPERAEWLELAKAQWVRALLGTPALLLVEWKARDVAGGEMERLGAVIDYATGSGCGVVWAPSGGAVGPEMLNRQYTTLQVPNAAGLVVAEAKI